jgi:integrase
VSAQIVVAAWNRIDSTPSASNAVPKRLILMAPRMSPNAMSKPPTVAVTASAQTSPGLTDSAGAPLRFTPHDFRRVFLTDAVMHGMPPYIAQLVAGHRDINTTMGYKAVYPEEVINGVGAENYVRALVTALRPS